MHRPNLSLIRHEANSQFFGQSRPPDLSLLHSVHIGHDLHKLKGEKNVWKNECNKYSAVSAYILPKPNSHISIYISITLVFRYISI
jgi:hypothetical protein